MRPPESDAGEALPGPGWQQPTWVADLLLPQELGASDRWAIGTLGIPGIDLMERAGAALAAQAQRSLPHGPIAVLCGPGNNGGDGLIAARILHDAGRDTQVLLIKDAAAFHGDAALARDRCTAPMRPFAGAELDAAAGVIDALLGTGATGAPRGLVQQAIAATRARGLPVVACDLPTGVDAATGGVPGDAFTAVATVTFHRPSPGHVIRPGKAHVGQLTVADIGIPTDGAPIQPRIGALRDTVLHGLPTRDGEAHKYAAGAVVVIAGGPRYPGAGVLAVRGAQRGGAGYVTAVTSPQAADVIRSAAPEAIVQCWPTDDISSQVGAQLTSRADAVVVGPGFGDEPNARALVRAALASDLPMVLDADGLAPFAGTPEELRRAAPLIITPHAGELGRLLGRTSAQVGAERLAAAREAADRSGAIVVLKGDDTVIASPTGAGVAINDLPAPALATAGTGDVLAGAMGALLASGADPWRAACAAVRLHSRAGRLAAAAAGSVDGVVAWDVAEHLPAARGS
ncbi:MAG: NAD(P)H-hydrate dehydratase [Solirubrobacteraceae bacterium]|nr:NAD(P)H-hydrate dehydratase [Solirubrobacteraceae bacterium]